MYKKAWHGTLLILTYGITSMHIAYADCSPESNGAGSTPAENDTISCTGTTTLTKTYWTGTNNLTFLFSGNTDASSVAGTGIVRADTNLSGNTTWTANNISITNDGDISATDTSPYSYAFNLAYGDQNNPTNGDFELINNGNISYTNTRSYGAIYPILMWSPTGKATITNQGNISAVADSGYAITVAQYQRGIINNKADATISATGLYPYTISQDSSYAGWVDGSGYSPNYKSTEFTEARDYTINNEGIIKADATSSYGNTIFVGFAESSEINNAITGKISLSSSAAASNGLSTISYNTNNRYATVDIRKQTSPYVINNLGVIENTVENGIAISATGKTLESVDVANIHPDAFNPNITINQSGKITGQIHLSDGHDVINLKDNSETSTYGDGTILLAGGADNMTIGNVSSLVTADINGGGNAVIGDEESNGVVWDDKLSLSGFTGTVPKTTNWEFITLENQSRLALQNETTAGRVTVDPGSTLLFNNNLLKTLNSSLVNQGTIDLTDNNAVTTVANITGDVTHNGILLINTNLETEESDYVNVGGMLRGNGQIQLNVSQTASNQPQNDILIIKAANDSDKSDEDFSIVTSQRYNNEARKLRIADSPYVWGLKTSANNWVIGYASTIVEPEPEPQPAPEPQPEPEPEPQPTPEPEPEPEPQPTPEPEPQPEPEPTPEPQPEPEPEPVKQTDLLLLAEIPLYTSLTTIGREIAFTEVNNLHTRLGELRHYYQEKQEHNFHVPTDSTSSWSRLYASHLKFNRNSGFALSGYQHGLNTGFDKRFEIHPAWSLFAGLYLNHNTGKFTTNGMGKELHSNESGIADINTFGLGAYTTFFHPNGTYIDLVLQKNYNHASLNATDLSLVRHGHTLSGSIEAGYTIDLEDNWTLEPQTQLSLAHVSWSNFYDGNAQVTLNGHTHIKSRLGVRAEKQITKHTGLLKPSLYLGVNHDLSQTANIQYADTTFKSQQYGTSAEARMDMTYQLNPSQFIYGSLGYISNFDTYKSTHGNIGLRFSW